MKLSDLKINEYAIILSLNNPRFESRIRLLEMGITPGTIVKKTKSALFDDPIGIRLRGYELCISKKEASYIFIDKIKILTTDIY